MFVSSIDSLVEVASGVFRSGLDLSVRGRRLVSSLLPSMIGDLVVKGAFEGLMKILGRDVEFCDLRCSSELDLCLCIDVWLKEALHSLIQFSKTVI